MKPIIEVSNVSKRYNLFQPKGGYIALRDVLTDFFKNPLANSITDEKTFLALNNINFKINQGEIVGIIGPNGAGKSTLLKILTRITPPTKGEITLRGKVASLLEVGTGFHPELTGRENIFLNGSILGMTRKEVKRKFDEIVNFSGVEKFIDMPVKHYSSGMQVRLAFSVAAHLEPDILLVDEVLAVGDAEFQKKSLGKMESVSKQGRTVLFVSHNMGIITRLCQRGILLQKGQIAMDGDINAVVSQYLKLDKDTPAQKIWTQKDAPGDDFAKLKSVKVLNNAGKISHILDIRHKITIEMEYWILKESIFFTNFGFFDNQGVFLFMSPNWSKSPHKKGLYKATCEIPGNLFAEGMVRVVSEISTQKPFYIKHVLENDSVSFQVVDKGEAGSIRDQWGNNFPGVLRPKCIWENKYLSPKTS